MVAWLGQWGFTVNPLMISLCKSVEERSPSIAGSARAAKLGYDIDGVVYKVDRSTAGAARLRRSRAALGDRA
jgi:DNA ligase (NAD+)